MGIIKIILTKIYRGQDEINYSQLNAVTIGDDIKSEQDELKANTKKIITRCCIEFA